LCIGTKSDLSAESGGSHSEDCLFVNVFSPSTANDTSLLPVYVFIQGGGFNMNGNADYNGADLIDAGDDGIVVVNFNYRVGPYGFLASNEIAANQSLSLNNGLKDQRQALQWVQKHIKQFGGDPKHVTIGGASAGGGSVVLQLTAYGGRDDGLFQAAAAESAAFPPLRDVKDSQWQYDELLRQTGCKDLDCLTSMDAVTFQNAVRAMKEPFPGGSGPPVYFWNPTLDNDFVKDFTVNELKAGHYVHVPTIFGTATHDGVNFTPKNVVSLSKAQGFLTDNYPSMKWDAVSRIWGSDTAIATDNSDRWRSLSADIYGAIRYTCPGLQASSTFASDKSHSTWHYRWNVGTASHVGELLPIWNNATAAAGVFVQAYWASFIRSYDPNKHAADFLVSKGSTLESPQWEPFVSGDEEELVFNDDNNVRMEKIPETEQKKCEAIDALGLHLKQ
jgi:carboxylesterase type B